LSRRRRAKQGGYEDMNKTAVKIIKRKDMKAELTAAANVKAQNSFGQKLAAGTGGEKIERRLHRKMADTVSNWIAERKESNRIKEISAIRKLFGDESLLSTTA